MRKVKLPKKGCSLLEVAIFNRVKTFIYLKVVQCEPAMKPQEINLVLKPILLTETSNYLEGGSLNKTKLGIAAWGIRNFNIQF